MEKKSTYIPNFDLVRLAMALVVVLYHCWHWATGGTWTPWLDPVAMFILLSGFLVLQSFENSRSWGHFAWKRLLRVGPGFVACLALTGILLGSVALYESLRVWATAGVLITTKGNNSLWSLSVEEVLYGILPVLVALKVYRKAPWLIAVFALIAMFFTQNDWGFDNSTILIAKCVECFFVGNLLYVYRETIFGTLSKLPKWLVLPGCAALFVGPQHMPNNEVAVFLAAWALPQVRFRIPDLSYGVYIYHMPLVRWLLLSGSVEGLGVLWIVPVTLTVAAVSWYLIEKPALRLKDRRLSGCAVSRHDPILDGHGPLSTTRGEFRQSYGD